MPGVVHVVADDLAVSAARVDTHADNLRARHGAADSRIDAARPGLPAGSAAALSGVMAKWQQDTTAYYTAMADHSIGLRSGAASDAEVDASSAEGLDAAGRSMPSPDLGL